MNPTVAFFFVGLALVASAEIIQGPSLRALNVGPDGSFMDSIATGGAVIDGSPVRLVPPTLHGVAGAAVRSWVPERPVHYVEPTMVHGRVYGGPYMHPFVGDYDFARSFYEPAFYHDRAFAMPYGKAVIAGPSGTIVADHH